MKSGGGKGKGGAFEREIATSLSKWITNGEKIDCLWRSAMSGGRATVSKGKVRQGGDISSIAPEGHILADFLYIECKHLKNISFDSLIKQNGPLLVIWQKTIEEAAKYKKHPVLIFRQNHWPTVFCAGMGAIEYLQIPKGEILIQSGGLCALRFDRLIKIPFTIK
jgi:hypothetical protein